VLYAFCPRQGCSDGAAPYSKLIFDHAGNLYGTTNQGGTGSHCASCGVVFELTPQSNGSWTESVLYNFCSASNCSDGGYPAASVVLDSKGNLYGTAFYGGDPQCNEDNGCGVVFKLAKKKDGSWTETVLHAFAGEDGSFPYAAVIFDQAGNLYGTTSVGGTGGVCDFDGCGVVFELLPNADGSWTEKTLHQFTGGKDGGEPFARLILDRLGNLYGTTTTGGDPHRGPCTSYGCGVVFRFAPTSKGEWRETVLHRFLDFPGDNPYVSDLIFDGKGNLLGTTAGDGTKTSGSVFVLTP
jgi:uncharacterized repeat protein (TIGR03803 family)